MRILIVEDEKDLNRIITKKLTLEGWICESCFDGEQALAFLESELVFDAVILDVMIPRINGFEVLRRLRSRGINVPVLLLTAKDAISDRVTGLDLGADDYLIKPFAFEELMARLRLITRKSSGVKTNIFTIADLSMDILTKEVSRNGQRINLSAKEFAVLEVMIRNKGIVLSREHIEDRITSIEKESNSNVIDVYIRYLRKKIDDDFEIKLIHTVRGSGYVLRDET
ncbi:MAG: two-component system OmpR family copper resistance phosphate regulon response regulator CusR [Erysipelotrichaceae bacterium]|nr:MAG: two-component system OmpR family copper resistance phosphate regulon response regulator [Erysipelotrichaceae bacterium]TXT19901.1 MAG: two-component system OmpR family copper resistance phosphate regulon response regulator CusR [Erysipelotrichaceae bacterium]